MPGMEARFREEKRMSLLAAPLVSEGTLHYAPPGRLVRHTTKPAPSTVLVDGGMVRFGDARGSETLQIEGNPVARLFVDSFLKILAGDRAALEALFAMELKAGAGDVWELRLRPKVDPMPKMIERIELSGRGLVVASMRIVETGGDETVTAFTDVDAARRYDEAESARVFRLPAR